MSRPVLSGALLRDAVAWGRPLLLDGSIGMQLAERGFMTDGPGWASSATWLAPELLRGIYRDYVEAGADILTANTFRMHARSLAEFPNIDVGEAIQQSVAIARSVEPRFVVGSAGPLEDCYHPEATPDDATLVREHCLHAERIAAANVDALLLETMPTYREAMAGLQAGLQAGLSTWVSFWCASGFHLGDGVSLSDAVRRVADAGAEVVLLNCFPAEDVLDVINSLSRDPLRLGAYANTGRKTAAGWLPTAAEDPQRYAWHVRDWLLAGCRVVGGCCGTSPAHIAAVRQEIDSLTLDDGTP